MSIELETQAIDTALKVEANSDDIASAIQDGLTVAIAGLSNHKVRSLRETLASARPLGPLPPPGFSDVWFTGQCAPAAQAALLNGMAIHANDFDDTHDAAIVHCMAAILPAALAGAQLSGSHSSDIAAAVTAGTELACNLALARGEYAGWHYTTLLGTMGAALACSIAAGASKSEQEAAVGNSYVFAAGNKQSVLDSSLMKRIMPGFAAQNGVLAFQSMLAGLEGVDHWLSGQYGLFELFYGGSYRPESLEGGSRARISELSYKPYPACRFTHGAIEAAEQLHQKFDIDRNIMDLGEVAVRYPNLDRFGIVCRPFERRGADEMDAQFSTAYLVASALIFGSVDFDTYTKDRLADVNVEALAHRVKVTCDLPPGNDSDLGPIEVIAGDDTARIETVLGSLGRPLTPRDRRRKFSTCVGRFGEQVASPKVDDAKLWELLSSSLTETVNDRDDSKLLGVVSTSLYSV